MSAIRDDINEYVELCAKYGETVQYVWCVGGNSPDCYGAHAKMLQKRFKDKT